MKNISWRGIAAATIVMAAGSAVLWWIAATMGEKEPETANEQSAPSKAIPDYTGVVADASAGGGGDLADSAPPAEKAGKEPSKDEWRPYSNVRPPNVPQGQAWKPGRKKIHNIEYVEANAGGETVHRNATEQTLLNIFTCELGEPPRPLGNMVWKDKQELIEILASPNPVTEQDTENMKVSKEILAEAKAEMSKYISEGGDPQFFLQHYHTILLNAWKKRRDAEEMAREILERDNDPALAKAFVKKVNAELEAEGIKRIYIDTTNYSN